MFCKGVVFIVLLGEQAQAELATHPHLCSRYQTNNTATDAIIAIKNGYISLLNCQVCELIVYSNSHIVPGNG